jgi:hypothetical protein
MIQSKGEDWMRKLFVVAAAGALLAGCGGETPVENEPEAATALEPGQYQADWKVASLRITDKNKTAATNLKQDATGTTTACIAKDNAIDPALFAEDGDTCTIGNPYVRNGRLQMDLTCSRKGSEGQVRQSVSGTFTADSLDAEVSTTTYLSGYGDYAMSRTFTAKRLGECPPAADTADKKAAEGASG